MNIFAIENDKMKNIMAAYNANRGEQRTICEECGNSNLAHSRAIWTGDGASYCPPCFPIKSKQD